MSHHSMHAHSDAVAGAPSPALLAEISITIGEVLRLNRDAVTPDSTLLALGAQSLDFVELVFRLERVHRIRLARGYAIVSHRTVRDYAQAVAAALDSASGTETRLEPPAGESTV